MQTTTTTIAEKIKQVSDIISATRNPKRGERKVDLRIEDLRAAGFQVSFAGVKWDFGTSGTIKEVAGVIYAQLGCAYGTRARRSNYRLNKCFIYEIN